MTEPLTESAPDTGPATKTSATSTGMKLIERRIAPDAGETISPDRFKNRRPICIERIAIFSPGVGVAAGLRACRAEGRADRRQAGTPAATLQKIEMRPICIHQPRV